MSDIQVSALVSTGPKPKCGCEIVLNESYDDYEYEVDNRICLYPAAVVAHEEALKLKRERTKLLLEAKALIVDLIKDSAWPHNKVHDRAEEFLRRVK